MKRSGILVLVVLVVLVVLSLLATAGCGDDDDGGPDTAGTVSSQRVTPPDDPDSTDSTDDPQDTGDPGSTPAPPTTGEVELTEVATVGSLSALAAHPDTGDLFLAQRDGAIVVYEPEGGEVTEPVLDLTDETEASGEQGLLGLAIAPTGDFLYAHFTNNDGDTRLWEFPLDGRTVDASGRRELLALEQPYPNHNGGELSFGPDDHLYLALGDGGSGGDPHDAGQDREILLGKILRIDPAAGDPYGIPADNPFADGGGAPEVWLFGVRNPWRFSWDRDNGDLWIADVGQDQIEEIDRLPAEDDGTAGRGANLGWNRMEGDEPFSGEEPAGHVGPVFTYTHEEGCSVTGGYVYRGERLAFLDGVYVFGDFCTSQLWGLRLGDSGTVTERIDLGVNPGGNELVSFGQDLDGELYVLTQSGTLYRLDPAG
jgi:glucose/arabinose dehydrogenase